MRCHATSWALKRARRVVPDLPGCIAAAETRQEVTALIKDAIDFHLEGLRERGEPIPPPASEGELIETDAA